MSLERVGNSQTMSAIQKRIKEIQADLKANPAKAREIDARIDAEHARLAAMTQPDVGTQQKPQATHGRTEMRRRRRLGDDEDDV